MLDVGGVVVVVVVVVVWTVVTRVVKMKDRGSAAKPSGLCSARVGICRDPSVAHADVQYRTLKPILIKHCRTSNYTKNGTGSAF